MKVLIVDDDTTSRMLLRKTLKDGGDEVREAVNGLEAWEIIQQSQHEIVLTDWMMPLLDGLELVRRIRERIKPAPLVFMITAIGSVQAKGKALESGADGYITKPFHPADVLAEIENGLNRQRQGGVFGPAFASQKRVSEPPFVGVGIAASTGGPSTLRKVIPGIVSSQRASFFVVQHGPVWMLESFAARLQDDTAMKVNLAEHEMPIVPGEMFLAPGDQHMVIDPAKYSLLLNGDPPENFVRPAADPLFRSMARVFGKKCIAVVLTGMGRDGTIGSGYIAASGGIVIAQDPATAILPSMPQTVVDLRIATIVKPAEEIGKAITARVDELSRNFKPGIIATQAARSPERALQDAGIAGNKDRTVRTA